MAQDFLGNSVTLEQPQSEAAVNDFVEGLLACEARVVNVLQVSATDASPYVQACCAALHLFAESRDGQLQALPFIDAAQNSPIRASRREQMFVQAIAAWSAGDIGGTVNTFQQLLAEHPRDLASLKLAHYHLFNVGDSPGMLRLALASLPAAADVAYQHGMTAFAWEQCHFLREAETAARHALALQTREPWAQHALAHVMLTQGRIAEGADFMDSVSASWTGLNSFMQTHNWWHLALFELERGRGDAALDLYDKQVWGVVKEYSQDQIGAVSLLARLELCGVDVGDRWQDLADYLSQRLNDHVLPFLDLQYLYGLARAGRAEAAELMRNLERHASPATQDQVWAKVCLPASRGLLAHAEGRHTQAVEELGLALPNLLAIGGSHAQRDLFEQIYLDALLRSGQLVAAQNIIQQRSAGQPESRRLQRLSTQVLDQLGLHAVATMQGSPRAAG